MLKRIFIFFTAVLLFTGCQQKANDSFKLNSKDIPKRFLGVWKSERPNWAFKIEPDGKISKVYHVTAGYIDVEKDGGKYLEAAEGLDDSLHAAFIMGDCSATYDSLTSTIEIVISVDYYEMVTPAGTLKGSMEDHFTATLSKDGCILHSEWRSYSWLEGATAPDRKAIDANPQKVEFKKMPLDNLKR